MLYLLQLPIGHKVIVDDFSELLGEEVINSFTDEAIRESDQEQCASMPVESIAIETDNKSIAIEKLER